MNLDDIITRNEKTLTDRVQDRYVGEKPLSREVIDHGLVDQKGRRSGTRVTIWTREVIYGESYETVYPARTRRDGSEIPEAVIETVKGWSIDNLDKDDKENHFAMLRAGAAALAAGETFTYFEVSVHAARDGERFGAIPRGGRASFATLEEARAFGAMKAAAAEKRNRKNKRFSPAE